MAEARKSVSSAAAEAARHPRAEAQLLVSPRDPRYMP